MRRLVAIVTAAGLTLASAALLGPARAAEPDPAAAGAFSAPFREDGNPGSEDTAGCKVAGDGTTCLPSAASTVVLPNNKVLYWNALEGTESIKLNAVLEGGDVTVDDQSRVLSVNTTDPQASTWEKTDPLRGGDEPGRLYRRREWRYNVDQRRHVPRRGLWL